MSDFDMAGIKDAFNRNPTVEVIEFVNYNDGGDFRLSSDKRELRILNEVACVLAELPNAKTEEGHVTQEGYHIYGKGGYDSSDDSHKYEARVHRPAQNR